MWEGIIAERMGETASNMTFDGTSRYTYDAWNRLVAEPGRLRSLCDQPWIQKVAS